MFIGFDKMNFKSIDKLSSENVIALLKNQPESKKKATRQYLMLVRYMLKVFFLDKSLDVCDRVYYLWYTVFFLRCWRQWLKKNKFSLTKNFITLNAYCCIELNGHSLLLIIEKNRQSNCELLPWFYSSQSCEETFRHTRSMTITQSTIVNYSLTDILRRLNTRRSNTSSKRNKY